MLLPCDAGSTGPECVNTWLDTPEARTSCRVFGRESSGQQCAATQSRGAVQDGEVFAVLQAHINVLVVAELQFVGNQADLPVFYRGDGVIGGGNGKQTVEERQFLFLRGHAVKLLGHQKVL